MKYKNIHEAVCAGDMKSLIGMVAEGASVNEIDEARHHFSPLHWAAYTGSLECMHWLLSRGGDTSISTPKGWTPLHIAAIRGQDACAQALLNNKADLSARDVRGSSATHLASSHGNATTLTTLLRFGADIKMLDKNGWAPIHCAAFHGRFACLQILIKWGSALNDPDNLGNTLVHLSAMEGQLTCLKLIVSNKSSSVLAINARNNNGDTPKNLAHQFCKKHVVDYIDNLEWERQHPEEAKNRTFPAHLSAYTGDLQHLQMLVENQIVNMNERDDLGSTPLHKAAGQGHLEIVQYLLDAGADATVVNTAGETARDVARRFTRLAAFKMLGGDRLDDDSADKFENGLKERRDSEEEISRIDKKDILKMTPKELKKAKMRSKQLYKDIYKKFKIAGKNLKQMRELAAAAADDNDSASSSDNDKEDEYMKRENVMLLRKLEDLELVLDGERRLREKLEQKINKYKNEMRKQINEDQTRNNESGLKKKSNSKK